MSDCDEACCATNYSVDDLRERLQALCRRIGHNYDALPPHLSRCQTCGAELMAEALRAKREPHE